MPDSTLLRFIQLLPNVPPRADFLLQDLPGSGKRIDVLCRDLSACFDWAPISWRKDRLEVVAVLQEHTMITFHQELDRDSHGEVAWASIIQAVLRGERVDGVKLEKRTLEDLIRDIERTDSSEIYVLDEKGASLRKTLDSRIFTQNSFMLGNHRGFDLQTEELIQKHKLKRVSLGQRSYLSSHCIAAIISYFERMCR